jgi:hypothetical protein
VLKDLGQLEEARNLLRQAYPTYLSRFGPDHSRTRAVRRSLEDIGG